MGGVIVSGYGEREAVGGWGRSGDRGTTGRGEAPFRDRRRRTVLSSWLVQDGEHLFVCLCSLLRAVLGKKLSVQNPKSWVLPW